MKRYSLVPLLFFFFFQVNAQNTKQQIFTEDIYNFWKAYDQIIATTDSSEQYKILQKEYLDKGSPGLAAIRRARRYSPKDYIDAINNHPLFWKSIRENTLRAKSYAEEIEKGIARFAEIYPDIKPAQIYFTIGAFRTPGTTIDSLVLIGAELAMGNSSTIISEFPPRFDYLKSYFETEPIKEMAFLNVHEYVHTQQIDPIGYNLLTFSFYEGVAEFVAEKSMGTPSPTPAIAFGKKHDEEIKKRFSEEMFSYYYDQWLWNNTDNAFQMRDLGYYIGYAIADKYYQKSPNKRQAIKALIEIDYTNEDEVEDFINEIGYFSKPIAEYREAYEKSRPRVVAITSFENESQEVDPNLSQIQVSFSEKLLPGYYSSGYGEKGESFFPKVTGIHFSEDGKSAIYEVELEANKEYQFVVGAGFRTKRGIQLRPYTISFRTAAQ